MNAAVTISSATPTCCSAMKIAITTTAPFAILATVGTPDTLPADARITPRTNSPRIMPRITMTIPAMSVGMKASIVPNI